MTYTQDYHSPLGKITLASNGNALTGLWFDGQKYFGSTLAAEYTMQNLPIFVQTTKWLDIYFNGLAPNFTPPLQILTDSAFRWAVWQILQQIPFGQTTTYGQIAAEIARKKGLSSMSAQAVGSAVAHNPISIIIPCHRVIGVKGGLTGYAGGLEKKRQLLALEGACL